MRGNAHAALTPPLWVLLLSVVLLQMAVWLWLATRASPPLVVLVLLADNEAPLLWLSLVMVSLLLVVRGRPGAPLLR